MYSSQHDTQHTHTYPPELGPQLERRHVELQDESQPPEEGLVNVLNEVGGENDDAGEALDVVEKDTHVHVGITISGGPAEEGYRRVREGEEEVCKGGYREGHARNPYQSMMHRCVNVSS